MAKRLVLLLVVASCVSYRASAQNFGRGLVLTWEDDARIRLLTNPNSGAPVSLPLERISGGLAAGFLGSFTSIGPVSAWLATDFRMQGQSFTIILNREACGGHLGTVDNFLGGVGTEIFVNSNVPPFGKTLNTNIIGSASPACTGFDTAVVKFQGTDYTGFIQYEDAFTGTVDAPGEVSNATGLVIFGKPDANGIPMGVAIINGTLRAELSDYNATVVKLRQGIPPAPPMPPTMTWSDGNPPWESDVYDSSTVTKNRIYNWGCALTSLSMALNHAGAKSDPGGLNSFMNASNYYTKTNTGGGTVGNVQWGPTTQGLGNAIGKKLKFISNDPVVGNTDYIDSQNSPVLAEEFLDQAVRIHGAPVIVGVEFCDPTNPATPCHFVTVWGKRNGQWLIADPIPQEGNLTLSGYGRYATRGYIADPVTNVGSLNIVTGNRIELTLTSANGAQAGFAAGAERIPASAYFVDKLIEDDTADSTPGTSRIIQVFQPTDGKFQLTVTGSALGTFEAEIKPFSSDGSPQPPVIVAGVARPGSISSFDVQLTTSPGATSTVARSATTGSALADIANSLSLGLISKPGIAQSLSAKLNAAGAAKARGDCTAAVGILQAFMQEVGAQTSKAIDPLAAQVLLEDTAYLLLVCDN